MNKLKLIAMGISISIILLLLGGCNKENLRGSVSKVEKQSVFGTTIDSVYENKFIGIGCKLPSDWKFYTDEEIEKINGFAKETLDKDTVEAMESVEIIYDMYAYSSDGSSNINVTLERKTASQLKKMDLDEVMVNVLKRVEDAYKNAGFTNFSGEIVEIEIDDKKFVGGKTTVTNGPNKICQKQILIKCDQYVASVTVTAGSHNTVDNLLKGFYLV